jgi:hypothetical protein
MCTALVVNAIFTLVTSSFGPSAFNSEGLLADYFLYQNNRLPWHFTCIPTAGQKARSETNAGFMKTQTANVGRYCSQRSRFEKSSCANSDKNRTVHTD